jgi:hypothetical protein
MILLQVINPSNGHVRHTSVMHSNGCTMDLLINQFGLVQSGTERTLKRGVTRLYSPHKHLYLDVSSIAEDFSGIESLLGE